MLPQTVLECVLLWALGQLQCPLRNGLKAVVMVCHILPLRVCNTASNALVDADFAASTLLDILQEHKLHPYSSPDTMLHLFYDPQWVQIVKLMLCFQGFVRQQHSPSHWNGTTYDVYGALQLMGDGRVLAIHARWKQIMESGIAPDILKRVLVGTHRDGCPISNLSMATLNGRSASEPRIHGVKRIYRRSRSLPLEEKEEEESEEEDSDLQ